MIIALSNKKMFIACRLLLATGLLLCSACFVTDGLTEGKTRPAPAKAAPTSPAPPPPLVETPHPDELAPGKLARRLSLDLLNRFPARADVEALTANRSIYNALVDSYLATSEANRALSDLHPRMWRFKAGVLPDFEAQIAAGDTTLAAALTAATRAEIIHEPALAIRRLLDRDEPFPSLFTAKQTIVHPTVATLYGLTAGETVWAGEPYVLANYPDARPAGGLLVSNGVLSAFASEGDPQLKERSAKILTTFGCYRMEASAAHLFFDLTASELTSDLSELASSRKPCIGCHAQFHDQAKAFEGLASASTFSQWLQYSAPTTEPVGRVAQGAFTGMAEMSALIGADSRTHRCEIERLAIELYQRRTGSHDDDTIADGMTLFQTAGQRIKPAIRQLLIAPEYKFAPVPATLTTDHAQVSTGVRVLKRPQWMGILKQLSYTAGSLDVPDGLEPGADEIASDLDHVPSGTYFHFADRLARRVATAVVNDELQAGATAATRRVFTMLPDGTGDSASADQINAQIRATWEILTSTVLVESDQTFLNLQTLWTSTAPEATPVDFKRAWRVMLVAMLTHPDFLTY